MSAQRSVTSDDIERFCADPLSMAHCTLDQVFSLERTEIDRIQLAGLRKRFAELLPQLRPLKQLAEENRISALNEINAVVPLLFPHTVYKSYPMSLIDNGRFEQLNLWLNDLTTHDLSGLDVSGCQSLDEWLDVIEANTPVRVMASSGTSGKISILPRSTVEQSYAKYSNGLWFGKFGDEKGGVKDPYGPGVYYVLPFVRHGRHNVQCMCNFVVEHGFHGDESHLFSLGGSQSTDVLWMTGRLKKAQADGMVEQLKKTKAWQRLSGKLAELESRSDNSEKFYLDVLTRLKDKTVLFMAGMNYYLALVNCAEKHGLEIRFASDSVLMCGGGLKRNNVSDADLERIRKAIPHDFHETYGCGELTTGASRLCPSGHYHINPWLVNFVLDPDTGAPYPRQGIQTGRYAGFDLWAVTTWGGYITGDEVTMNWDGGCSCGRKGPYLHRDIGRYSDKRGGDDKITCQRTAAAIEEMAEHFRK